MKIYYFGELIEENGVKVATKTEIEQTKLAFDEESEKKVGLRSIGDILKEIDLSLDGVWPMQKVVQ